ncbi:c-type cytochrome [Pontibacter sp. MBLB2868]|uniref:c-type cytochrome n=1 Tax=Pontibacter sp. MBLB2868 TaxID=3451555 RepID=UPI003F74E264
MKKSNTILFLISGVLFVVVVVNSCSPTAAVNEKPGAQLWAENCQRCHNTPPPNVYDDKQWDAVTTHMQIRAYLTKEEAEKVKAFLQESN